MNILHVEITQKYIDAAEALRGKTDLRACNYCVMTQALQPLFKFTVETYMADFAVWVDGEDVQRTIGSLPPEARRIVNTFDRGSKGTKPQIIQFVLEADAIYFLSEFGKTKLVVVADE